jgi:uncharacterized integral membrane protein
VDEREREFDQHWQPKLWLTIGVLILIAAYLIAFVVGNSDDASVNFIFAEARTSLIWVILLSLLAGLIGGILLSQLYRRRQALGSQMGLGQTTPVQSSEASTETPSAIDDGAS